MMFYTINTNKGYVHNNMIKGFTDNMTDCIKFKAISEALRLKQNLLNELEPRVVQILCEEVELE